MKELWLRRLSLSLSRTLFVSHPVRLGRSPGVAGSQRGLSSLSVWFCRALKPSSSPCLSFFSSTTFSLSLLASPSRSGSRYFKAVPRAPSRGSSIAESAGGSSRFAFVSPIVRFPFQMSSSSGPFLPAILLPSAVVVVVAVFSHSSSLYLAACCPFRTATSVPKLRGAVRPSLLSAPTGRRAMYFGRSESALVN